MWFAKGGLPVKTQLVIVAFLVLALLSIAMEYLSEGLFAILVVGYAVSGILVVIIQLSRLYIYSGVLLGFHVFMAAFTAWVFLNRDLVVSEPAFVFSTFTDANLRLAQQTLIGASVAALLPWWVFARKRTNLMEASATEAIGLLLGRVRRIPMAWVIGGMFVSFSLALLFFMTNPSVLDIPYPAQGRAQWVPGEFKKLPTLLAFIILGIAYILRVQRRRNGAQWLLLAKVNFLVVAILMLLLTGSRGLFTFMWVLLGALELFLWYKRRGSLGWAAAFLLLAWLAYAAWIGMRVQLSSLPLGEVFASAMQLAFGIGSSSTVIYLGDDSIRLGDITMISASLFHLLYVIDLIRDGVSLGGSTFVNLVPQALPGFLDGVLWERPLNDNWRLAEQFYHGGGFLVVANAYWNGGFWVAMLFMMVVSSVLVAFDRYLQNRKVGPLYRIVYWLWLPVFIVQLGYGIQGMVRVLQLLVVVIVLERLVIPGLRRGRFRHRSRSGLEYPRPWRARNDENR